MLRTLIRLELRQAMRSFRLPGLAVLLGFFALSDPPITKYMDKFLSLLGSEVQVIMPPATAEMALSQLWGDIGSLGTLVLILITMGTVAGEKVSGVSGWILTRPVTRTQYIASKALMWSLSAIVLYAGGCAVGGLYTATLFGGINPVDLVAGWAALATYAVFMVAVTILASVLLNGALAAGVVSAVVMFAGSSLALLGNWQPFRFLPFALTGLANAVVKGESAPSSVLPAIAVTLVASLLLHEISIARFKRTELQ